MSGERLNDVLLLNVHIEQANSLDLINIAYNLVFANARRRDYFETFELNLIFFWFCLITLWYCSVHVYVHFTYNYRLATRTRATAILFAATFIASTL